MKKLLNTLLFIIFSVMMSFSQNNKVIIEKMNTVVYGNLYSSNYIKFDSYVTREMTNDPYNQYKYEIVLINTSNNNGNTGVTLYITGINVFVNNFNVTSQQYPAGFWVLVPSSQQYTIYWYNSNDPNLYFTYTWANIQFY